MPAPGDQHERNEKTINPYEAQAQRVSGYTAKEIASLSSKLDKQLGPEFISSRPGPGGQKLLYVTADKCISLANEVFGFNGWSSAIQNINVDFVDENQTTGKVSIGISVVVRVTLRDGTYHEDVGYGHMENCNSKGGAFEKAKKGATTDAVKRALRNFGNILGNCIHNKEYLSKVTKMKAPPFKWDTASLHRHSDFAPLPKKPSTEPPSEPPNNLPDSLSTINGDSSFGELDDEFGGDEFDEVDFSESHNTLGHPDEVALDPRSHSESPIKREFPHGDQRHQANGNALPSNPPSVTPPQPVIGNLAQHQNAGSMQRNGHPVQQQHPPFPPIADNGVPPSVAKLPIAHPQAANQPWAAANHDPPAGFYTARAAPLVQDTGAAGSPTAGQTFNPHTESPSIRKTSGVDHSKSKPINREALPNAANQTVANMNLPNSAATNPTRSKFVNPQLDSTRKIGMPTSPSGGPHNINRGSYKSPGPVAVKRGLDEANAGATRAPLGDLPAGQLNAASTIGDSGPGGDFKKQKLAGELS
ncbi:MAG: DNA repair protein rad52 [Sclerophora amabilis]|nr:MAG: DNA repair protein rad52 [Sclerophora amabilis]